MDKWISDTELVNSSISSSTDKSTERLKAPTRAKCKVWKYCDEWSRYDSKIHVLFVYTTLAFVETWQITATTWSKSTLWCA